MIDSVSVSAVRSKELGGGDAIIYETRHTLKLSAVSAFGESWFIFRRGERQKWNIDLTTVVEKLEIFHYDNCWEILRKLYWHMRGTLKDVDMCWGKNRFNVIWLAIRRFTSFRQISWHISLALQRAFKIQNKPFSFKFIYSVKNFRDCKVSFQKYNFHL